jgi:hypothetical protein
MAKDPKRKNPRREPRTILIEVGKGKRPTNEDVELAIKEKLAAEPTDVFRNTETLIIVIQDEGPAPPD